MPRPFRSVGYAIISADGMIANAEGVMPPALKLEADQLLLPLLARPCGRARPRPPLAGDRPARAEMEKGRVAGAGRVTEPGRDPIDNTSEYGGRPLSPEKLGTKKWFDWSPFGTKPEQAPFEREPERSSLTQPPPGYQTPSPNYPYGLGGSSTPMSDSTSAAKDPTVR